MTKVFVILLDAIEPTLVEKWMEDGGLPHMHELRLRGRYGRLSSDLKLAGMPWLPLYTGRSDASVPPYLLVWNPASMSLERLHEHVLDVPIFWRNLPAGGPRVVAVDMPFVSRPVPFNGIEITAWMTHDTIFDSAQTFPPELEAVLAARYGADLRFREKYGTLDPAEFLGVRDRLIEMTQRVTDLALDFLREESWDLFVLGYGTLHSAGHKLWDRTNVRGSDGGEASAALRQVYAAADQCLGRLLAALGPDAVVLVLSVHGMRPNFTRNEILPEMLRRVLSEATAPGSLKRGGLLRSLRQVIPHDLRHAVKSRLPRRIQDFMTAFWRSGVGNWEHKKAFAIASDTQGMIRINLQGREKHGAVPPAEYNALCAHIQAGLRSFVDADTGRPLIQQIRRIDAGPAEAAQVNPEMDFYPDLLVEWVDLPAAAHRAVVSPEYGQIDWPTPGHNPEGRSGNHTMTGLLIAAGPGIRPGAIDSARAIDIAPTVLSLLGQPIPKEMDGRPLEW